ncbi:DUF4365 domain-containing protein [Bacillus cereus]|uniref:DUF4365 domain-containing protein n=1 Tax=Bacillus cereus TaxID=1396 RepID=UPI000BEDAD58|nr:DUF4365 domain-containing protein [Bacillus cereus]PEF89796.1 hypothetical protein CON46_27235 [Bacillus cereus]
MRLPQIGDSRLTGNVAVDLLSSVLSKEANVIGIPAEKDMGIDLMCELLKSGRPTGMHFHVQCKGTENLEKDVEFESIKIKVSTLNYWAITRNPVLLVLVDLKRKRFYWSYPYDQIKDKFEKIQNQKTVRIKIFKENSFSITDEKIPSQMKSIIKEFDYKEIMMRVRKIELQTIKVGSIHKIYPKLKELKEKEKKVLGNVNGKQLRVVQKIREDFNYFFVTSDIQVWYQSLNQLCFALFKKTESGQCYYIATVVIHFKSEDALEHEEHLIELANGHMLDTRGNIYNSFESIVKHLYKIYK